MVEAVVASPGEGSNRVPAPKADQQWFRIPEEQIVMRYTTVVDAKFQKYSFYREKQIISESHPYVIAVNGNKVPLSWESSDEIPFIVQAVLPFGLPTVNVNWENPNQSSFEYAHRPEIFKVSGSSIQTNIFQRKEYEGISGIIFSKASVYEFRTQLGEDYIFIHNPLALNKLPDGWLGTGWEYKVGDKFLLRRRL